MDDLPGNDTLFLIYIYNGQGLLPEIQGRFAIDANVS